MKTLSPDDIECLLGIRDCGRHPLEVLGYGYSSEGVQRFRDEHPDVRSQIEAHIKSVLHGENIFPKGTEPANAGYRSFIFADEGYFRVSSMKEVSVSRLERIVSEPMSQADAIRIYIHEVTNPDYVD